MSLINKISNRLEKKIHKDKKNRLLLAISGGLDSNVLLHVLKQIKYNNRVPLDVSMIFINYVINDNSNQRENLCFEF